MVYYSHNLVTLDFKAVQLRTDEKKKGLIYIVHKLIYKKLIYY